MVKELKDLSVKYAINLFEWHTFNSKNTGAEKDSKILIYGDCKSEFAKVLSKRVAKVYVLFETVLAKETFLGNKLDENILVMEPLISGLEKYKKSGSKNKSENEDPNIETNIEEIKDVDYVIVPYPSRAIIGDRSLFDFSKYLIKEFTSDTGSIMLAFDNSKSVDIVAGKKSDASEVLYSYEDIEEAGNSLKELFNGDVKLYFPLPEFKFPLRIYSSKYLPKLEDEDKKTRNLVKLGIFKQWAASYIFLFEASKSSWPLDETVSENKEEGSEENNKEETKNKKSKTKKQEEQDKKESPENKNTENYEVIYTKYNTNRNPSYALKTQIIEDASGERFVLKKAITKEANRHVEDMVKRPALLDNKNVKILDPVKFVPGDEASDGLSYSIYPFIKGEIVSDLIIQKIKSGKPEKLAIQSYMNKLIGKESGDIEKYNLDCLFSNAIEDNGKIFVIDGEWIGTNVTEVNFLKYRILRYFYESSRQDLSEETLTDFLKVFGITSDDEARFDKLEEAFQQSVHAGAGESDVNLYNEIKDDISKYFYIKALLDRANEKIERIEGNKNANEIHINRIYELLRLTNAHASNLEGVIANLRHEIDEMAKVINHLNKHESIIYKVGRRVKKLFDNLFPLESKRRKIVKYIGQTFIHPFKMLRLYFTKAGRNILDGDFKIGTCYFDNGKLHIPQTETPLISIVIPCYNQIRYTYLCVKSIIETTNFENYPYELIIADDNSKDATKEITKYIENVVHIRTGKNLGFLRNCNNAAASAKGKYLVFLNNDTVVKENWLSSLYDLMEKDPMIGLCGSKLIFADGTLQEAGGVIWSDGTGWNYGRGGDPKATEYNYVREVDYISGASIMTRKNVWDEIGGFDERYAPAYCEDSDYAFEIRKYGMKVVYQPASEVIHYEGVSNGTDVNKGIKKYQIINGKKLVEKWEYELSKQFPSGPNPNAFRARERAMDKKVILFVDHYIPTWDKDAGSKTTFQYIKLFLSKGYIVKFLPDNFMNTEPYGSILQQMGVELLYGAKLEADIWSYLQKNSSNIDFVYLNRPHIATKYIDFIKSSMTSKIIYYGHDLHFLREQREYELTGNKETLTESRYYKSIELSVLYKSDMNYYPSNIEVEEIKKIDDRIKVKAIRAYIYDEEPIVQRPMQRAKKLLFVGGFAHAPNKDGIVWFAQSILPYIKSRIPDVEVYVVGSNADEQLKEDIKNASIELLGFVSDERLKQLYEETSVVIAPLRYGAGVKGKIIEALSHQCAVVTTTCGAEGIEDAKRIMKVAENSGEFAQMVINLLENDEERIGLSMLAKDYINKTYTAESAWEIIEKDWQ